jgi:hypothetical protein
MISYPSDMREDLLRRYFLTEIPVGDLVQDLRDSVTHINAIVSSVAIEDMQTSAVVSRQHLIMLCDAFLSTALTAEGLNTIAFALIASDRFEWEDDIISEVLSDWSAPEINFPLNDKTIRMHRSWLTGTAEPLQRQIDRPAARNNRLILFEKKSNRISCHPNSRPINSSR